MKKIVIYQEDSDLITLIDEDSTDIESYSKEISKLLESSKICILETTSGNVLIKPSKINSIYVTELPEPIMKKEKIIKVKEKIEDTIQDTTKSEIVNQDIIKD